MIPCDLVLADDRVPREELWFVSWLRQENQGRFEPHTADNAGPSGPSCPTDCFGHVVWPTPQPPSRAKAILSDLKDPS